jgi:hypothetical protein
LAPVSDNCLCTYPSLRGFDVCVLNQYYRGINVYDLTPSLYVYFILYAIPFLSNDILASNSILLEFKNCYSSVLLLIFKKIVIWAPVAHTHNSRYLGGRDQKDQGSKPAWVNSSQDLISKINTAKWTGSMAQESTYLASEKP